MFERDVMIERSFRKVSKYFIPESTVTVSAAAFTTIATIPIPTNSTMLIESRLNAVRTDAGQEAAEGSIMKLLGGFRNDAGTVNEIDVKSPIDGEDDVAVDRRFLISGTDVLVQFLGVAGKDFKVTHWALKSYVSV